MTSAPEFPGFEKDADAPFPIDDLLKLEAVADEEHVFVGKGGEYPMLGVYGGHLIGQALAAAFKTVAAEVLATSLHLNFVSAPEINRPIVYRVEILRNGRRYSSRMVRGSQGDKVIIAATASFKAPEQGDEHEMDGPSVPSAAELRAAREAAGDAPFIMPITSHGVDIEQLDGWTPITLDHGEPKILQWMRALVADGADQRHRQCVLAYLSDSTSLFAALRPHGSVITHATTSLDHAIWFHRPCEPENWLLCEFKSPIAIDTRGLTNGTLFDADGHIIASIAQESSQIRRS